jgi:hypothetical protein
MWQLAHAAVRWASASTLTTEIPRRYRHIQDMTLNILSYWGHDQGGNVNNGWMVEGGSESLLRTILQNGGSRASRGDRLRTDFR